MELPEATAAILERRDYAKTFSPVVFSTPTTISTTRPQETLLQYLDRMEKLAENRLAYFLYGFTKYISTLF